MVKKPEHAQHAPVFFGIAPNPIQSMARQPLPSPGCPLFISLVNKPSKTKSHHQIKPNRLRAAGFAVVLTRVNAVTE